LFGFDILPILCTPHFTYQFLFPQRVHKFGVPLYKIGINKLKIYHIICLIWFDISDINSKVFKSFKNIFESYVFNYILPSLYRPDYSKEIYLKLQSDWKTFWSVPKLLLKICWIQFIFFILKLWVNWIRIWFVS